MARTGSRRLAASPISANFSGCWVGMKLASVTVRKTSGSAARRGASRCAASSDGASTLIALGVQSGSDASASSVTIDSAVRLFRLSGLKSKRSCGSSAHDPSVAAKATARTARRRRLMNVSTGASIVKPTSAIPLPDGRSTIRSAGRSTMVSTKATIMPRPAIAPSSATPT